MSKSALLSKKNKYYYWYCYHYYYNYNYGLLMIDLCYVTYRWLGRALLGQ